MRIAIDALGIDRPGGGRSASLNLLDSMMLDRQNEYIVFLTSEEPSLESKTGHVRQIISPTKNRFLCRLWAQITWPKLLRNEQIDLIHHIKNLSILGLKCPSIVTVYDLTILRHPDIFPKVDVLFWRYFQGKCLHKATHIITLSQETRSDLFAFYGIPQEQISVISCSIADCYTPIGEKAVLDIRQKYGLEKEYILHVGSISGKKNLATLAKAYFKIVREYDYPGALVLVGRRYWKEGDAELDAVLENNKSIGTVILTGSVPQSDLPGLYAGAECFCFPSLHEGFGLVPLEAAACGTPIVSSRVGVIESLLGEAGSYISDPKDYDGLANLIWALVSDPKEREKRSKLSLEATSTLSRKIIAETTISLYDQIIKESR